MKATNRNVCGIQVEKDILRACIITGSKKETQNFKMTAADVLALYDWILANRCTRIVIEGTKYAWKSIYYLLAFDSRLSVTVIDYQKTSNLLSRKKQGGEAERIAMLLQNGRFKHRGIRRNTVIQSNNRRLYKDR